MCVLLPWKSEGTLKVLLGFNLITLALEIAQQHLRDIFYTCNGGVLIVSGVPTERVNSCRGNDSRQHVRVSEPVDGPCIGFVLPGVRVRRSKTMYCNYTKNCQVPLLSIGLYCLLNRRFIISTFFRIHLKQTTFRDACRILC